MEINGYPIPCECGKHRYGRGIPGGRTHRPKERCPFTEDSFPVTKPGNCCELRGKRFAAELAVLGDDVLFEHVIEDMTAEEALEFADNLRTKADQLELRYCNSAVKPRGALHHRPRDRENAKQNDVHRSTFDEALAEIRLAARWYEKVGRLGYGVYAWS